MKWISVKDQLPPKDYDYLATDGYFVYIILHNNNKESGMALNYHHKNNHLYMYHSHMRQQGDFSHWMSLPKMPPISNLPEFE